MKIVFVQGLIVVLECLLSFSHGSDLPKTTAFAAAPSLRLFNNHTPRQPLARQEAKQQITPNSNVKRGGFTNMEMQMKPEGSQQGRGGMNSKNKEVTSGKTGGLGTSSSEEGQGPGLGAWLALALLLGLNVHNQWTRALVYYLVSFKVGDSPENSNLYMNKDLGFGEEQYSVLASFGFVTLYTAASLVAGRVADKVNRATVVASAAALWSLSTAATSLASTFDEVLALRALTGVSQAFVGPQAYGLIAQYFAKVGTATANSVYSSGVYVGGALASLSILLDGQLGWRDTSLVAGGVGLALAMASGLILRDPRNLEQEAEAGVVQEAKQRTSAVTTNKVADQGKNNGIDLDGAIDALKTVLGNRFVQILFMATAFRFCAGYGIGVWKAPFYREAFPDFANEFSIANAFVISGGGILSSLIGGLISDKFSPKDQRVQLWVPAVGSLLAVPFWIATVQSDNFYTSMSMLFLEYIAAECWFGPVLTSLYKAVPKEVQGTAQGLFTVLTAVGNIMPVVIGSLQKDYQLPDVLAVTVSVAYVMSGLLFLMASFYMPEKSEDKVAKASE